MGTRAAEFNTFVFALPRDEGYEFVLSQFAVNEFHFTTLINYQAFGENAPECLTIVYYTDMEAEKGITLMRGEFDSKLLGPIDAQFLANQIQLYYASSPGRHLGYCSSLNIPRPRGHMSRLYSSWSLPTLYL